MRQQCSKRQSQVSRRVQHSGRESRGHHRVDALNSRATPWHGYPRTLCGRRGARRHLEKGDGEAKHRGPCPMGGAAA